MKIILKDYIENVGDRDDVVTVADGYARNFLIPKGFAVRATSSEMKQLAHRRTFEERRQKRLDEKLAKQMDTIRDSEIEMHAHASSEGKLYGSIAQRHIAGALTEKFGVEVDRRRVKMESPIKMVGEYQVVVDMGKERTVNVKVIVSSGGGPIQDPDDKPAEVKEEVVPATPAEVETEVAPEPEPEAEAPAEETGEAGAETGEEAPAEEADEVMSVEADSADEKEADEKKEM